MKKMKGIKIWSAACAMLLAVSCLATMVFAGSVVEPVGSSSEPVGTVTAQSEYVCRIAADDMTNTPPYASAGVTDGFGSEAANGRVWVDKSVQANDASNAFDVTLSALAQEYSYSEEAIETIMEQNAADVLFILDFSSSMTSNSMKTASGTNAGTRLQVLAESLNSAMKEIAEVNPYNRIMAVAFDGSAYDFLPLGSYTAGTDGNYVKFANNTISTVSGVKFTGVIGGVEYTDAELSFSKEKGSGTHMQIGITYGCDQLLQNMTDGFGEGKRLPFVMVMTDGESNYSNDNWAGVNLESNNGTSTQREANSTLASTFWKKRLIDAYNAKNTANGFDGSVNAVWFNIGVGLGDPGDNASTASAVQVSMKPSFASPDATSTSNAGKIYTQILTRLENAYNNPQDYVGDPLNGYDDLLARAGIDVEALRTAVSTAVSTAESEFNAKLADPNSDEAKAIKAAGEDAAAAITEPAQRSNFASDNAYYTYIKNNFGIDHSKNPYKSAKNDDKYNEDVAAKIASTAAQAQSDAEAAKKAELYDAAVGSVEAQAMADALEAQDLTIDDLNAAVQGYFEKFLKEYMGYDGTTQAERQTNYAKNPMHYFAEYVNYADTSTKVNDSFDQLASLISAATQGTVIPITHHATSGAAADEIFITFTDTLGKGTTIKTDDDGNYIMSVVLKGVTYTGRPKSGAATGVYEFYNETEDKVLYSTATISDSSVKWEINAYELPIIRFANRMLPGEPVNGKVYEDPNLAPIAVKYEVMPTADALANTATNGNFIYEHDDIASAPAKAVFTPTPANTYYFKNNGTMADPDYEKVTAIEETIDKATDANKSETATYVTKSAWGTGDDADDFIILLGNDARTKVLAEVSIEDDRMEDATGVTAHTYGTDETITYTLKVKNLSDEKLENLTYTLDVTPSGPTSTDTPSALTVGTCSTTPDSTVKSGNKQTLTFTLDELAAGATETVTVPMTPATGTKNGVTVDAVITLTKVFDTALVTPATDEVGEVLIAEDVTVYTYLDNTKTNLTGITGAPTTLYIKKDGGNYIALTKDTATATYIATNIPIGEYTIYDGNSGTPNALGKVSVVKDGDNIGNVYWETIVMTKIWNDNSDQDGQRWDVKFNLNRAIGTAGMPNFVACYTLTKSDAVTGNPNTWKKSVVQLAKDPSGFDYQYTINEAFADNPAVATGTGTYSASYSSDGLTITNTHTPETTSVTMKKVWDDNSDQDGKRPASVTLTLYKQPDGGTKTKIDDYTFNGTGNEWTKTIENLPKYEGGKLITYTANELTDNVPTGYTKAVSGLTVTNSYTPEVTSVTLKKVWDDNSNQDGKRPTNVTLTLYKQVDGGEKTKVEDVTFNGTGNEWTKTVENLPKYEGGKLITYTADETTAPTDYTKSVDGLTVTNKHVPETTSVSMVKKWDDHYNQDGLRTANVTLTLYKQVEGGEKAKVDDYTFNDTGDEWLKTVENLPKYESGKLITYTADETTVPTGYTKSVTGLTVTNSHTPEVVSVTLKKVWDDNSDQDGKRPTTMKLMLLKKVGAITSVVEEYDLSGTGNEWTKTIDNLPKYEDGVEITYLADEDNNKMPSGYAKISASGLTVTNQHVPETKTISGTKTWDDADYVGKTGYTRPNITVNLIAKVDGAKVDALCKTTTATAAGNWEYAFYDAPVYQGGKTVTYIVEEAAVDGFTPTVTDFNIKNTPIEKTEVLKPVTLTIKKVDSLTSTGKGIKGAVFTLTDEGGASTTYTTLDDGTVEIPFTTTGTFTLTETTAPTGYQLNAANTYTVTVSKNFTKVELNTDKTKWNWNYDLAYELTDVQDGVLTVADAPVLTAKTTLTKAWDDNKNQDGVRPTSVVFGLYKTVNGTKTKVQDVTLTGGTTAESWTKDVENLPIYEDGYPVTYTIEEETDQLGDDYSLKSVDNDTLTITNFHKPGVTSATLKKVWDDNSDQDGKRPESVTLTLYKTVNGTTTKVEDYTFGGEGNEWSKKVEDLPKFEDGFAVTYTADELEANVPTGYEKSADGLTVTNTHTPEVADVTVKKVWDDNSDQDGKRPEDVTLSLYKTVDGEITKVQDVTFDGTGDEWTKTIEDLPVYEGGFEITYTANELTENVPTDYIKSVDGLTVTNIHTPEVTDVTVKKVWVDENDADKVRPEDVTLTIYKTVDGETTKVQDVTFGGEGNEWTKTIEDLPVYENGFEITYTVDEATDNVPEGYVASVDGLTVRNTRDVSRDITVTVENGDSDVGDKATVTYGDDKTITFTPNEGYALDTVTVDGETAVLTDGKYTFTDITDDHEIIVKYAEDKNGDGIPDKYQATVTYKVVNGTWEDGDADAIDALFDMKEYVNGVWNELNPTLGDTVPTGMKPDDTHIVPGAWDKTCNGDVAVVDGDVFTYTFDKHLTHTITVTVEGGTSDVEGGTATVIHKDDQTVAFTPDEGKVILSVVIDGEEVKITDDLTYIFTDVTDDHEIKVTFADDKNGNGVPDIFEAQVTYQVENGTWADGTTDDIVENFVLKELKDGVWTDTGVTLGDTIPTGMTPTEYYTEEGAWNTEITADTAVTTNATYRYTFGDEKTHTITVEIQNGTSDPDQGSFPVKHKEDQDVKITPNEHYVIDKIIVDGEEVEIPEDGTIRFTEIETDHDIQVICEEDANDDMIADKYQATVAIDIDKDAGEATGDGIYWKGETATVTATPNDGYRFTGWMLDGEIVSMDPTFTFTADANVKLTALFEKIEEPAPVPTTTTPTAPQEAPATGDAASVTALLLLAAAAGVLVFARKRETA